MGTWTLGRVGLDVVANSVDAPATWEVSGDDVRFTGVLRASSVADAKFLRLQLNGLINNPDEPWVPFTWSEDPTAWDMFVTVNSAKVSTVPMSLTAGWFPFEVSMTRLADAAHAPQVESRLCGGLRANAHGIVLGTTVPWWATPDDATMDFLGLGAGGAGITVATRTADTGSMSVQYASGGIFLDDAFTSYCSPADWYDGAAKIELTGDNGSTWRAVTGTQIPNLATSWRINNGLVRVTYGGAAGLFTVQHYVGGSWITAKTYRIHTTAGATVGTAITRTPTTVTILRNSPECVSIRVGMEYSTSYRSPIYLDLRLRRGALWVDGAVVVAQGFVDLLVSLATYIGVGRNTAEAATGHTSGLHATAADAAGGKYTISTSVAKGDDTTQGGFWATTQATVFPFMIGYEPPAAAGPDTFTNQTYSWFANVNERQYLVQR